MSYLCSNSYLEVDLNIIKENLRTIRRQLPAHTQLIPVLKGNAYGFGAIPVAKALTEDGIVRTIAVAQVCEAAELRQAGITQDLLVLGAVPLRQLPQAVQYDVRLSVFDADTAAALEEEAARQGKQAGIHFKIETGLNRIGVRPGEPLEALLAFLKQCPHLKPEGVFSHFIDGEIPNCPTAAKQLALFREAVRQIEASGFDPGLRHISNSGASEWYHEADLDAVRIGRRLYMDSQAECLKRSGTAADDTAAGQPAIREPGSWRTEITALHGVPAGESVGYNSLFTAKTFTRTAVIGVGYGDGLCTGLLKAGGYALIHGKKAPYLGMCMDQTILDVSGIDCAVGDEVTLFGRSSDGHLLSAQYVASLIGNEGVYLTDILGNRVERRYLGA